MDPSLEKEMWACQWYVFTIQYDLYIYKYIYISIYIFINLQNSDPDNILETLPDIHV